MPDFCSILNRDPCIVIRIASPNSCEDTALIPGLLCSVDIGLLKYVCLVDNLLCIAMFLTMEKRGHNHYSAQLPICEGEIK